MGKRILLFVGVLYSTGIFASNVTDHRGVVGSMHPLLRMSACQPEALATVIPIQQVAMRAEKKANLKLINDYLKDDWMNRFKKQTEEMVQESRALPIERWHTSELKWSLDQYITASFPTNNMLSLYSEQYESDEEQEFLAVVNMIWSAINYDNHLVHEPYKRAYMDKDGDKVSGVHSGKCKGCFGNKVYQEFYKSALVQNMQRKGIDVRDGMPIHIHVTVGLDAPKAYAHTHMDFFLFTKHGVVLYEYTYHESWDKKQ